MALAPQLPKLLPDKFILEVIDGPDRGAKFQIFSGEIKIGRGDGNDIILNDPKCSREHALLKITTQAVIIEDLGSQHGTVVDGEKGLRAFISNGSKITIGLTTLVFKKVHAKPSTLKNPLADNFNKAELPGIVQKIASDPKKVRFYAILFGVVILALFLFSSNSDHKKVSDKVFTPEEEIENSRKRQDELMKEQIQSGKASRQYIDAQAAFTKGLRDYREGLYKSSITSFNAALAIYPEHPIAKRYLRLAQLKLDEKIQITLQEGNRFMEQGKYQNAKVSFQEVMILVGDPQSKIYQEAKEKYNECVLILRESF